MINKVKFNKKFYRWFVELVIILSVLLAVRFWMQRDVVTGTAPNIIAVTLKGQHFELYKNK